MNTGLKAKFLSYLKYIFMKEIYFEWLLGFCHRAKVCNAKQEEITGKTVIE